jgi:hypothetical protein
MVQRYGEYTYRQGWMRGIVGGKRRGKEMDGCFLTRRDPSFSHLHIILVLSVFQGLCDV